MANVKFVETTSSKLDSLPITEGQFTFTTDSKLLYRDTADARVKITGTSVEMSVDETNERLVFTLT